MPIMSTKQENDIHEGIGYWVGSLASAFRKGLAGELEPFDVSPAQWAILEACDTGKANPPSSRAQIIPVDTAAISRHRDKLKDRGQTQRRRSTRDRRSIRVGLTEAGRELVPKLMPFVQANNAKLLAGITEEDHAALTSIIRKMQNNADTTVFSEQAL